jgi:hypothetical protein
VFRLTNDIIAIEPTENRARGIVIPNGNTIRVLKCPSAADARLADVLWDEKPMVIFRRDLRDGAKEMRALAAKGAKRPFARQAD